MREADKAFYGKGTYSDLIESKEQLILDAGGDYSLNHVPCKKMHTAIILY